MKQLLNLLVLLLLVTPISFGQNQSYLSYNFEKKLIIGSDDPNYMFANPRFISVDSNSNIYVGDIRYLSIRVYDQKGYYIREIGNRGRGPGEFTEISYMLIDDNDNLLVFDRSNLRITRYNHLGDVISQHSFPDNLLISPLQVSQINENKYLILGYKYDLNSLIEPKQGNLLHITDKKFNTYSSSLIPASRLGDVNDQFYNHAIGGSRTAHFTINDDEQIFITPFIYNGFSYIYTRINGRWIEDKVISGHVYNSKSHTIVTGNIDNHPSAISLGTPVGRVSANLHNECIGVFTLSNQKTLLFSFIENNGIKEHGLTLFSREGNFIGYSRIKEFENKGINNRLPGIVPVGIDQNDHIYFVDYSETPNIMKVKFNFK